MAARSLKYDVLLFFYRLTEDQLWLHEFFRKAFLLISPHLINVLLARYGSVEWVLIPRHSLMEKGEFNLCMSDLDFSVIVTRPSDVMKVRQFWSEARKWLPNLGEVEIYTRAERQLLDEWSTHEFAVWWRKLQLIRKWSWIAKAEMDHPYHELKRIRALEKIRRKFTVTNRTVLGENHFFGEVLANNSLSFQLWSHYLNAWISGNHAAPDESDTLNLVFETGELASKFHLAMPTELEAEYEAGPYEKFRHYALVQEILLARASMRLGPKQAKPSMDDLVNWHMKLEKKLRSLKISVPEFEGPYES